MGIVDILRRRGAFRGELRRMIDDGIIFRFDAKGRRVAFQAAADTESVNESVTPASARVVEVVA